MNKAGGFAAFGNWAQKRIKTKVGAQLATIFLGLLASGLISFTVGLVSLFATLIVVKRILGKRAK